MKAVFLDKRILLWAVLFFLTSFFLQQRYNLLPESVLLGAYHHEAGFTFDSLSTRSWFSGKFQTFADQSVESDIGFHKTLIRIHNQIDFTFFRKGNAEGVVVGKNGELFEKDYIRAVNGEFFVGEKIWKEKAQKLRLIQDTLSKLGKALVILLEPGKGTVFHDRIPDELQSQSESLTNNDLIVSEFKKSGLHLLDLNPVFLQWRNTHRDRVFPQGGTHWSYYGAALAADTVLHFLQKHSNKSISTFTIVNKQRFDRPRHPDADIWQAMNLLQAEPNTHLVYPVLEFDQTNGPQSDVLFVGDSFYFNWQSDSIAYKAFGNCDFWYYNKHWWNRSGAEAGVVKALEFSSEIMKRDLIVIAITERFHHNFAWNFDEELFSHFYPDKIDPLGAFANNLRCSNDQFMRLVEEAKKLGMSLEKRINLEAQYLLYEDFTLNPNKYTRKEELVPIIMMSIRQSPQWLEQVKAKAESKKISLDEMIRLDAEWLYQNKYGKKNS